jgi:hypothetical protein
MSNELHKTTGYNAREREAEIARLTADNLRLRHEVERLHQLLRRPKVWAAHAAEPNVVAPECDCAIGFVCQREGCCYSGEAVPSNVRDTLEPAT